MVVMHLEREMRKKGKYVGEGKKDDIRGQRKNQ